MYVSKEGVSVSGEPTLVLAVWFKLSDLFFHDQYFFSLCCRTPSPAGAVTSVVVLTLCMNIPAAQPHDLNQPPWWNWKDFIGVATAAAYFTHNPRHLGRLLTGKDWRVRYCLKTQSPFSVAFEVRKDLILPGPFLMVGVGHFFNSSSPL